MNYNAANPLGIHITFSLNARLHNGCWFQFLEAALFERDNLDPDQIDMTNSLNRINCVYGK